MNPLVSVIIPVFNTAHFIVEAIESVLSQTYQKLEIIIVDDHSSDDLAKVLSPFISLHNVLWIKNPKRLGPAGARNVGVHFSAGEYVAFLDADDIWHTDKLSNQLMDIKENGLGFTLIESFDESTKQKIKIHEGLCPSCLFIRKQEFITIGYFDETLQIGEFLDWYMRAKKLKYTSHVISKILAYRRIHPNNTSRGIRHKKDYLKALMKNV